MKTFLTVAVLICSITVAGQQCNCDTDSTLSEMVTCFKVKFSNHAKIYRQFNCDSSWLTFENNKGIKTTLYSLESGLIEATEKLGYQYAAEYKATFLIQNNLISGCCTPPEYLLFSKSTGTEIKNLGRLIFYSDQAQYPLVVSVGDTTFSTLKFYDVNSKKIFSIALSANKIKTTLKSSAQIYAEYLFESPEIRKSVFYVTLNYRKPGNKEDWFTYKVTVDLKPHGY
jgi:hypothetical protein